LSALGPYLPPGLPAPAPSPDGLDAAYWEAARRHELACQRCRACGGFQWGPEWICHRCLSFDLGWERIEPRGRIYGFERVWHPVHPALREACPYLVVLVELPEAPGVRMIGNLLGDPRAEVKNGDAVEAVFEDHDDADPPFTLVQWKRIG
jgi:hypothetical protein